MLGEQLIVVSRNQVNRFQWHNRLTKSNVGSEKTSEKDAQVSGLRDQLGSNPLYQTKKGRKLFQEKTDEFSLEIVETKVPEDPTKKIEEEDEK